MNRGADRRYTGRNFGKLGHGSVDGLQQQITLCCCRCKFHEGVAAIACDGDVFGRRGFERHRRFLRGYRTRLASRLLRSLWPGLRLAGRRRTVAGMGELQVWHRLLCCDTDTFAARRSAVSQECELGPSAFPTRALSTAGSVKIPALVRRLGQPTQQRRQIHQSCCHHVAHVALALPSALYGQQPRLQQRRALALTHALPHDHLDHPGFVFQRDEDHALGRLWLLAQRDDPAAAHQPAIGQVLQFLRALQAALAQHRPQ